MLYWNKFKNHDGEILGIRKKYDNTIYSFDIETTSYLILNNKILQGIEYQNLTKEEKEQVEFRSCMYIWMFGINDTVYYGRTWEELKQFLTRLEMCVPVKKYVFVHNLSFEFQYLKSVFHFKEVTARKSRKVMTALMQDFNIFFKCSYLMSNCALEKLSKTYSLPVEKKVGDLDYSLLRHSATILDEKELGYCEYDCLVVYHYIKRELETYITVNKIPTTNTGKVRRELQELTREDFKYKRLVRKSINTDTHVYNLLCLAFMGGYTHSNWIHTSDILENVDSYDICSSYPTVLTTCKFPSSEFIKCYITRREQMSNKICYLLTVKFKHFKSKYFNNFVSLSKCRNIRGGKYDNGRIISADEFEITLTDIDFYFILDAHKCEYEILECYCASYNYLPKQFIEFVLDKYVAKTKYKDVEGKEVIYQIQKGMFNSLYGMSVTRNIRDKVIYKDELEEWEEIPLTNEEIIEELNGEKKRAFMSFAWGVWVTAYARDNLLRRVIELDDYVAYCDTDSIKLIQGYDKNVFEKYNNLIKEKIYFTAELLDIDVSRYEPKDIHGKKHLLGLFECETKNGNIYTYDKFITHGAKKYAYEINGEIHITVAGVPKKGAKALRDLKDFKDGFIFDFKDTNKMLLSYVENQNEIEMTDYQNNKYIVTDKSGCCLVPNTYELGRALEYAQLVDGDVSERCLFNENEFMIGDDFNE